jgi:hypothetical protein
MSRTDHDWALAIKQDLGDRLIRWGDTWCHWSGTTHEIVPDTLVEVMVLKHLCDHDDPSLSTLSRVRRIVGYLRLLCFVPHRKVPCWLNGDASLDPKQA